MNEFPSRQEILNRKSEMSYKDKLVEQVKTLDIEKVDFEASDFKPRQKIVEKQRVFRWSRLFVKDEVKDLMVNDTIKILHTVTGEELESSFICFAKKNLEKDSDGNIVAFTGEEDKKVLCLMIDIEKLENEKVKFIRTLFQNTRWYEYQLLRRNELLFINSRTGEQLEYFDVTF